MSEKNRQEVNIGTVKISEDVIASVAAVAASEVDGVKYLSGKKASAVSKKAGKFVRLTIKESSVTVDISIVIKYGCIIPDVGYAVQEHVQEALEAMTGLKVAAVNVHCTGIAFSKDAPGTEKLQK